MKKLLIVLAVVSLLVVSLPPKTGPLETGVIKC